MKIKFNNMINEFIDYCKENEIDIYLVGGATRDYLNNISKEHINPTEQRAFDKAIAALEYCEKQGFTYYVEEKYFDKKQID